jgi:transcriptional regulator with XRE-family HTH domain
MMRQASKHAPLAVRLRQLRAGRGMKSAEVAEGVGIDPTTLSRLEHGRSRPSIDSAQRLADFYGVSLDTLLDSKKNEE